MIPCLTIAGKEPTRPNMELEYRDYQQRIHDKAIDYLDADLPTKTKTCMLESPCGSGKTLMALRIAKHWAFQGARIGWIAHRRELLDQMLAANNEFKELGIPIRPISLFDRHPDKHADLTHIVIDEAHADATASAAMLHEAIKPKQILGLTATPYRTDNAKLMFAKVIKDAGIHQLIREGWLAPFEQWMIEGEWTAENVAAAYLREPARWGKTVCYFPKIAQAMECADILRQHGIAAQGITGVTPNRRRILDAFHDDQIQVLTNVAVLTEGFDCCALKTVFVRPSRRKPTVQMSGRVFRKHPDTPIVNVVQNHETHFPFTRHARAEGQYIWRDNDWMSMSPKNLAPILNEQRRKILKAKVDIPDFLAKINKRATVAEEIIRDMMTRSRNENHN